MRYGDIGTSYASLTVSNFPNPFNPDTVITYQISEPEDVSLVIYNVLGQEVRSLVSAYRTAGSYRMRWDGRNNSGQAVASGRYIYHLKTAQGGGDNGTYGVVEIEE